LTESEGSTAALWWLPMDAYMLHPTMPDRPGVKVIARGMQSMVGHGYEVLTAHMMLQRTWIVAA